jgi:GNAT superfamily N-acetyltransferase
VTSDARFTSSVLVPGVHDVAAFDSGEPSLDTWLRNHAAAAARARVARTFVWTGEGRVRVDDAAGVAGAGRVVAYYALSAHAVVRGEAPSRIARGVPDPVPAALIAKLALDRSLHGQRLGDVLLADALDRIISASAQGPAVRAIVVDAATPSGRALYERFGFVPAPGRPDRMIVRAETIAAGLGMPG